MSIDMQQFYQVFFDEADELLAEMERLLLAVDVNAPDADDLNAIFRAAHSIKGGASTFGITDLTEVTHVLETLLDRIRKGEMALGADHVDAFLAAKDILKMQLNGHRLGSAVDQEAVADVRVRLQSLSQGSIAPAAILTPPPAPPVLPLAAGQHCLQIDLPALSARDAAALQTELALMGQLSVLAAALPNAHRFQLITTDSVDDVVALCSFIVNADQISISTQAPLLVPRPNPASAEQLADAAQRALEQQRGYGFYESLPGDHALRSAREQAQGYGFFDPLDVNATVALEREAADQQGQIAAEGGAVSAPGAGTAVKPFGRRETDRPGTAESSSIRVGIEKVDQLINLVGELVITQAMVEQRSDGLDPMQHERLLNSISQLMRNTRDLQQAVMSIRMMPMDYVFSRFPRMVRDLAGKLGKKVDFITHGAATELDKGLIERIVDPLTHLVRNSIDHGIETPELRLAAGKNETGRLSLSAGHHGGNIVIEVSDDGGGLNREKILAKAAQQQMAVSDTMTDAEVWQLIFAPGFSTAEEVTDVSGRGVGMDVVKQNISAMGGAVEIRSAKGFGTTISISLPLTLAILDGMSIKVGSEIYILPLGYVIESLKPAAEDVKQISGQGQVVKVRGEYLPLLPLYQMFGVEPLSTNPVDGIVVILESEGKKAALFVDDLVGQQQVVVKNLESNYRKVAGISGATILGDGGVSLIIDVSALLRSSRQLTDESIFT